LKKTVGLFSLGLAILAGVIVLLGYFIDEAVPQLGILREHIFGWVVILTAVAVLIGVANLARNHWSTVAARKPGRVYSLVTLVSLAVTLVLVGYFGPSSSQAQWMFNYIQIPIETSLMGMLIVILIISSARLITRRPTVYSFIFILTVIVMLVGVTAWRKLPLDFHLLRSWILQVPATAGGRGILLGVVLGTIATAVRILMGTDRPYEG
jgi:hypothetical protein